VLHQYVSSFKSSTTKFTAERFLSSMGDCVLLLNYFSCKLFPTFFTVKHLIRFSGSINLIAAFRLWFPGRNAKLFVVNLNHSMSLMHFLIVAEEAGGFPEAVWGLPGVLVLLCDENRGDIGDGHLPLPGGRV